MRKWREGEEVVVNEVVEEEGEEVVVNEVVEEEGEGGRGGRRGSSSE